MKSMLELAVLLLLATGAAAAPAPTTDGEVARIDRAQSRITLRHDEIRNLGLPAMTMVFRVADGKMLDGVAVGDRVRFAADKIDGRYTVITLIKAQ